MKPGEHSYKVDAANKCFISKIDGGRMGFGNRVANGVQVTMIGETKGKTFTNTVRVVVCSQLCQKKI